MPTQVETVINSSVRDVCKDIIQTNEYPYYYAYGFNQTECYLIQSKYYDSASGAFSQCLVTEFHFVHDDDDHISDWRMWSYNVDLFYPVNNENYIVYTNALPNYPVLRGDIRYDAQYYFAGSCCALLCAAFAVAWFRISRINHSS